MGSRTRLVLGQRADAVPGTRLIRWTGANVLHLSYFSNFVLLGSFLGIGLGFLRARRPAGAARSTRRSRCSGWSGSSSRTR